jgi:hypothetical protein
MSEFAHTHEAAPVTSATIVVRGTDSWLQKEIGSSVAGANHYLDDHEAFLRQLALPLSNPLNQNAQKNAKYHFRTIEDTHAFIQDYGKVHVDQQDKILARQMFNILMQLSGLFRVQCHLQAENQEDYYRRRLDGGSIGVDLEQVITERLEWLFTEVPEPDAFYYAGVDREGLVDQTVFLNASQSQFMGNLQDLGAMDAGHEKSRTVDDCIDWQRHLTRLFVDYTVFSASQRGGQLAAVPLLRPGEDRQIYYPFSSADYATIHPSFCQ